jgi:hypothetical protein
LGERIHERLDVIHGQEKPMRRTIVGLVLALALAFAASAFAGSVVYANYYWYAGKGAGSSYSSSWWRNMFSKQGPGFDTTITFIDNAGYGWHATVRGPGQYLVTHWLSSQVKKAHCVAHASNFYGTCVVVN